MNDGKMFYFMLENYLLILVNNEKKILILFRNVLNISNFIFNFQYFLYKCFLFEKKYVNRIFSILSVFYQQIFLF